MKTKTIQELHTEIHDEHTYYPVRQLHANKLSLTKKEGEAFTESIKRYGFLDPLVVNDEFSICDGRKRYYAAVRLGLEYVPCIFAENTYIPSYIAHISTAKSDFSHFFDKAKAIQKLTSKHLFTQDAVAAIIDRSQSYVANKLRLLKFTPSQIKMIIDGDLSERHARTLLRIKSPELCTAAICHVIESMLTVSETEEYVDSLSDVNLTCSTYLDDNISRTMRSIDKLTSSAGSMGVLLKLNKNEDRTSVNYTIKIYK